MAALDVSIQALTDEVAANKVVEQSALLLINGFQARLDAAIAAAAQNGASPAQLTALTKLSTDLKTSDDELAAAVAANTTPTAP